MRSTYNSKVFIELLLSFAIIGTFIQTISSSSIRKVCKVCKQNFLENQNSQTSCKFHAGRWMGAENSKHLGTKSGGANTGLSLFWDCCQEESSSGQGCVSGRHKTYDEDDTSNSYMLLSPRNKKLSET